MSVRVCNINFLGKCIQTAHSDGDSYWEENFYILQHSLCPTVHIENFFKDGLDMEFLQSRTGKQVIIDTHMGGIIEYIEPFPSST